MHTATPNTHFVQKWNPVIDDWTNWDSLRDPLSWNDAHLVAVCPDGDLFDPQVSDDTIDHVFAIMLACQLLDRPAPRFELLTRHAYRLHQYLTSIHPIDLVTRVAMAGAPILKESGVNLFELDEAATSRPRGIDGSPCLEATRLPFGYLAGTWPLPCLSLGIHIEDQNTVNEMLPLLNQTPAARRWVQFDELLGPVILTAPHLVDVLGLYPFPNLSRQDRTSRLQMLDRVVVSENVCRDANAARWVRSLERQCSEAKVTLEFTSHVPATVEVQRNFLKPSCVA